MAIPAKILLYRIVHWQNVEHILRYGLCLENHPNADPNFISVGHKGLIRERHDYPIRRLADAGSLGEYIPFYFGPHSPMLLMIKNGTHPVAQLPQEDIVYLISSVATVQDAKLEYCFTDKHAKRASAGFYRADSDFDKIDWEVVKDRYWFNTHNYLDRQDRKQAEFLIRHYAPPSCILWLGVKSPERKAHFAEMIDTLNLPIRVYLDPQNKLYY